MKERDREADTDRKRQRETVRAQSLEAAKKKKEIRRIEWRMLQGYRNLESKSSALDHSATMPPARV